MNIVVPPAAVPGYQLKFSDDFHVLDLNLTRDPNLISTWTEGLWFQPANPQADISAGNSVLSLKWHRGPTTRVDVSSLLAFQYGYFEIRARWSPVLGAWPAFWMEPQEAYSANAANTGEIDVFEFIGDAPGFIYTTWHEWHGSTDAANNVGKNYVQLPSGFDTRAWHKYAVLWTAGKLTWYLDDAPVNTAGISPIFDTQHFYPVLSMAEGINWVAGALTTATPGGQVVSDELEFQVDYIRVWQAQ